MDLKVRNRTEEELLVRKKEFLKICEILDYHEINFFVTSGVLLGAIRDNSFIKWDWDVELSTYAKDFNSKIDLISDTLEKSGFKIIKILREEHNLKIDFKGLYPEDVTFYTIYGWQYSKKKDIFWRTDLSIPSKFLLKLSKFNFLDRQFNCPSNVEEFLTFIYGNWKKPIRTSNKKVYLTKNFKKQPLFYTIIIEKIFKKIYKIFKAAKNLIILK